MLAFNETILLSLLIGLTAWSGSQTRRKYPVKERQREDRAPVEVNAGDARR